MKNRQHEPSTKKPLELGEFLCFAIYAASHAFNRVYQPLLKELELTYPQFIDRKSTRLNSSHEFVSRMPSSA